ncbi:peptide ABC transporter permease [Pseudooceanicola lipolyticus]|uniref:Peptide ABC transporter permease n=1 Tax=Pseudooceanicola lipolyticus TaxID=2029104 RepID=A0A2M8IUM6_9RHOB|nr:ABC transporter permease [Pseudooceanicola lipolyticus]PJE34208.1 peptide ABC transporter permease [Pseudooceanicola lipolyticus]
MRAVTSWLSRIWRADALSAFGLAALLLLIFLGIFGPWLPLGDPTQIAAGPRLGPPTLQHPFGTDELGRSFLPRVVQGIRATFLLSAVAVLISAVIGTLLGMAAGYFGRAVDIVVARGADILFAFPAILVGLLVAAVLGPGQVSAIAVIAIATLPLLIRVVRSVTLSVAGRGFVTAAEVAGVSALRILLLHILPNVMGAVMVQLTYALSIGMIIESALSFLGLGVQPPEASLGSLLRQGSAYLTIAPWMVLSSGAVLSLAIMSVNLVGDAVRDALEPLKGRALT